MYIPIYRKWWFWVGVLLLSVGTFVLKWQMTVSPLDEQNQIQSAVQQAYVSIMTKRGEEMVAKQKADTYGGDTPEETLKLFVEALEKKDYELASRYYVVEEQEMIRKVLTALSHDDLAFYKKIITAQGELKYFSSKLEANINFFINGEQMHFEHFMLNEYTKKWKLTDN